jgi:hypothetical protein
MKISFRIHLAPGVPFVRREDLGRVADLVKMAEDYGAEAIGTYDSAFKGQLAGCLHGHCQGTAAKDYPAWRPVPRVELSVPDAWPTLC